MTVWDSLESMTTSPHSAPVVSSQLGTKLKGTPGRELRAQFLVSALLIAVPCANSAEMSSASASSRLHSEVVKMTEAMAWPEMIRIALARDDLQRKARAQVSSEKAAECVNQKYTVERVLAEIVAGYEQIYSDPDVVAQITRFIAEPGAKKIFAAVAARAPAVGVSAAYEEHKSSPVAKLTPEEIARFDVFAKSEAGKAYLAMRPAQQRVHQERLAALAGRVARECSFQPAKARAQTLTYDTEAELVGAAMVSPESTRLILLNVVEFCSTSFPSIRLAADGAYTRWVERHTVYLGHSSGYRAAAREALADKSYPEANRAQIRKLLEDGIPRMVQSQTQAIVTPLQIAKENGTGDALCMEYFNAIDAGKFDLAVNDPQLTEFFDTRGPKPR